MPRGKHAAASTSAALPSPSSSSPSLSPPAPDFFISYLLPHLSTTYLLPHLNTRDATVLRTTCRASKAVVTAFPWHDALTPIRGPPEAWLACFPHARAANIYYRRDLRYNDVLHCFKEVEEFACVGCELLGPRSFMEMTNLKRLDARGVAYHELWRLDVINELTELVISEEAEMNYPMLRRSHPSVRVDEGDPCDSCRRYPLKNHLQLCFRCGRGRKYGEPAPPQPPVRGPFGMPLPPLSTEVRGICEPCYSRQSCCVCRRWECMTCHHSEEMRAHCLPGTERRQAKQFKVLRMRHCDTCMKAACHHCLLRCQFCAGSVCPTCRPDEGYRYWTCLKCCPWMPP